MVDQNDKIKSFVRLYFPAAVKTYRDTADKDKDGKPIINKDGTLKGAIPVLFTLAQKGLESDWGNKAPGFNFSGLTAGKNWKGKTQTIRTKEDLPDKDRTKHKFKYVYSITAYKTDKGMIRYIWDVDRDDFRAYDSAAEAFTDHAVFLKETARYKPAFRYSDPKRFADAIAAAGYASGQQYAKSLKACIDSVARRVAELGLKVPV